MTPDDGRLVERFADSLAERRARAERRAASNALVAELSAQLRDTMRGRRYRFVDFPTAPVFRVLGFDQTGGRAEVEEYTSHPARRWVDANVLVRARCAGVIVEDTL